MPVPRPRGWWLVWAIVIVTVAPCCGLLVWKSGWLMWPALAWAVVGLRVGDRLIERDVEREVAGG